MVIIGHKSDAEDERQVTTSEGKNVSLSLMVLHIMERKGLGNITYMTCTHWNVQGRVIKYCLVIQGVAQQLSPLVKH